MSFWYNTQYNNMAPSDLSDDEPSKCIGNRSHVWPLIKLITKRLFETIIKTKLFIPIYIDIRIVLNFQGNKILYKSDEKFNPGIYLDKIYNNT